MGTWHQHLDRRSKAGIAFHEGTMHPFYLAEEKRSAMERQKWKEQHHDARARQATPGEKTAKRSEHT